ncbi:UNVERIFIED_CONTAM: hypothetical protein Cloal_2744 [Acetivibrio alkalicellulosi]
MLFNYIKGYKVIQGTVYFEDRENQLLRALSNIRINLYSIKRLNTNDTIKLYQKKLLSTTKTNMYGKYFFLVCDDNYLVNIDTKKLPVGKGVLTKELLSYKGLESKHDFIVKKVHSIEENTLSSANIFPGNDIMFHPELKDIDGNTIYGRYDLSFDTDDIYYDTRNFKLRSDLFEDKMISVNIHAGNISKKLLLNYTSPSMNSIDRIKLNYESGLIDEKTKINNYLSALYDRNALDNKFASNIPIKSTTTTLKEIHDYIHKKNCDKILSRRAQHLLKHTVPELDKVYLSPSGYFKIHYTTSGPNGISHKTTNFIRVPDYIKHISDAFENVKNITCIKRNFRIPIIDEGKDSMDIYVYDLNGVYGYASSIKIYNSLPNGARTASCYIAVDNNYSPSKGFKKSPEDCLNVTAAHEFFHAVQFAYNLDADFWWMEASATWNEDEIYDEVNDYLGYLKTFFLNPHRSLDKTSYDGVIFAKFLSEHFGGYEIIRSIWETQSNYHKNSINAIDQVLMDNFNNENISTAYNRFMAYNYNPSQFYKEGHLWTTPIATQNTHTSYPVQLQCSKLDHLASNYQMFSLKAQQTPKTLSIMVNIPISYLLGLKMVTVVNNDKLCEIAEVFSNKHANMAEILIYNTDKFSEICFVPSNLEKEKDEAPYSYQSGNIQHEYI